MWFLSYSAEGSEIIKIKNKTKSSTTQLVTDGSETAIFHSDYFNIKGLDKYSNIQIKIDILKSLELILIEGEKTV